MTDRPPRSWRRRLVLPLSLLVLAITAVGWAIALFALRKYRARVAYWV